MNIKYYLKIGVTLLIIAAVSATMLALVNELTKDRIAQNELAVMNEAIERVFTDSDKIEEVEGDYKAPVVAVYEVYKGDTLLGYGVQTAPVGFKDKIGLIVGVDTENKCVGVEVISLSDTPGVGTKVKEKSFLESFIGYDSVNVSEVDTISGSTVSSAALEFNLKENGDEEDFVEEDETYEDVDEYIPDDELPDDYIPDEEFWGDLFDEPVEEPLDTTNENGDAPVSTDGGVA